MRGDSSYRRKRQLLRGSGRGGGLGSGENTARVAATHVLQQHLQLGASYSNHIARIDHIRRLLQRILTTKTTHSQPLNSLSRNSLVELRTVCAAIVDEEYLSVADFNLCTHGVSHNRRMDGSVSCTRACVVDTSLSLYKLTPCSLKAFPVDRPILNTSSPLSYGTISIQGSNITFAATNIVGFQTKFLTKMWTTHHLQDNAYWHCIYKMI